MSPMTKSNKAAVGGGDFTTSAPEIVPVLAQYKIEPNEFLPMPGPGQICPYSGLRRGALYGLWKDGLIETIALRRKGRSRGRRLIVAESLRNYLRRLRHEQCANASKGGTA
jgi:hypothetical protein